MITVGYSTRETKPEFQEYLKKSSGVHKIEVIEIVNNGDKSLSQTYNEILNKSSNDIVVLCHDDIYFDSKNWGKKLLSHFEKSDFGIIGVAGTTDIPKSGMWWEDRNKMVGIVNHENEGKKWESKYCNNFNNIIQEVCLIDGLFIGLKKSKIKKQFNENVKGFHFYDVYFSTENHLEGVKIGVVYDVRITHKSIGMTNEKWEENRVKFSELFSEKLPINLRPLIDYNQIKYDVKKDTYRLVIQSKSTKENLESFINSIKKFNVFNNLMIDVISNVTNYDELTELTSHNIRVFEGFFDMLNKNISVLKWDDSFIGDKNDLIFFCEDTVEIKNDCFSSIGNLYKKEKSVFGCAFPIILNEDNTIFSSGVILLRNNEGVMKIQLKNQNSLYNLFQGNLQIPFGNLSSFFASTTEVMKSVDWFEIDLTSNLFYWDTSVKILNKGFKNFIDTNSVISESIDLSKETENQELRFVLNKIIQNPKLNQLILKVK
jgi:predicted nucleic acid-binding protein